MKPFLFIALSLILMTSCSKKDPLHQEMNRLRGTWLLKEISGGFAGTGYTANWTHLIMTNQNRYVLESDGSTVQEGAYELTTEDEKLIIRFEADTPDNVPFDEFEKTLSFLEDNRKIVLSEPCCDLFTYSLERTNE